MSFETDRAALCFYAILSHDVTRYDVVTLQYDLMRLLRLKKNNRGKRRKILTVKIFSTINTIASAEWPRDLIRFDRIPTLSPR